jgi:hypothetical protein
VGILLENYLNKKVEKKVTAQRPVFFSKGGPIEAVSVNPILSYPIATL